MGSNTLGSRFARNHLNRENIKFYKQEEEKHSKEQASALKYIQQINSLRQGADTDSLHSVTNAIKKISKFLDINNFLVKDHAMSSIASMLQEATSSFPGKVSNIEVRDLLNTLSNIVSHPSSKGHLSSMLSIRTSIETIESKIANSQFSKPDEYVGNNSSDSKGSQLGEVKSNIQAATDSLLGDFTDRQLDEFRSNMQAATSNLLGDFTESSFFSNIASASLNLWAKHDKNAPKDIKKIQKIDESVNKDDLSSYATAITKLTKFLDSENPLIQKLALTTLVKMVVDISKFASKDENIGKYKPKDLKKLIRVIEKAYEHPVVQSNSTSKTAIKKALKKLTKALVKTTIKKENKFKSNHRFFKRNKFYKKEMKEFRRGIKAARDTLLGGITEKQFNENMNSLAMSVIGEA